jgi:sterol desaturase/sphingolipid hydroxylase (fatty acid hydroxylase superfamily)
MLDIFQNLSWGEAFTVFFFENLLVILLALLTGEVLGRLFGNRYSLVGYKQAITRKEWAAASITLGINTCITFAGFALWKKGYILILSSPAWQVMVDFLVLFFVMDFLMYVLHYVVHKTFLFSLIHQLHHEYKEPQPIDLFVLHPVETIGFGSLWLLLLLLYPANFIAILLYLTLNVLFGVLGHSGVEPFPESWQKLPFLKYIGSSTFHFRHHQQETYNFGFYTSIWDQLFGTAAPSSSSKKLH